MTVADDWALAQRWSDPEPSEHYPQTATSDRWAWEFLRRNVEYRRAWAETVTYLAQRAKLPEWHPPWRLDELEAALRSALDGAPLPATGTDGWNVERIGDAYEWTMPADLEPCPDGMRLPMAIEEIAAKGDPVLTGRWGIRYAVDPFGNELPCFASDRALWSGATPLDPIITPEERKFHVWTGDRVSDVQDGDADEEKLADLEECSGLRALQWRRDFVRTGMKAFRRFEVAVIIDLSAPVKLQLDHHRKQLDALREKLATQDLLPRSEERRVRESLYPLYLRLLDGVAAGASVEDMAIYFEAPDLSYPTDWHTGDFSAWHKRLDRARELLEPERYLAILK